MLRHHVKRLRSFGTGFCGTLMSNVDKAGGASASQELFTEDWKIYRKMVDNDYLFHRGAYSCLEKFLTKVIDRPFDFLDLACGDASMTVQALQNTEVASYEGIDISEQALEIARSTLSRLNCTVKLRRADFVEAIHTRTDPVDVVWIGLSLHHLLHDGKVAVAQAIRRLMGRDGCLLVYENTSLDGESRDAWLTRWDEQETAWTAYTPAEWKYVTAHVHQADFPETASTWQALGRQAGFATTRELFVSPTDLFRLYAFIP
jgi:ubiquinone/menaquinone biosynthesis C-methylase UbiE